ncbi:MAG: phosphoglycerate kinase [Thermodesulfobacteriota bacterium]
MNKQTVKDVDLKGKKVLVRCDFNVPLKHRRVGDDTRIRATLPTIRHLIEQKAGVVLCSHLGRPKGKPDPELSLQPVADHITDILQVKVGMLDDCIGTRVKSAVADLEPGEVLLLENTRFHSEEKANDAGFAAQLADGFDFFVNDAFGAAHRAHASTEGVAHHLPAVAGLLMAREIEALTRLKDNPEKPMAAIFGGAKISDKIGVIETFLEKTEVLLIGGGMANMFFKARGLEIGDSFIEEEGLDTAEKIMNTAGDKLVLPEDVIIAKKIEAGAEHKTVSVKEVPSGWKIVDIGPESVDGFMDRLQGMKTVIWNGPLGVFETKPFDEGTNAVARKLADLNAEVYIGGGDSGAAVNQANAAEKMTHVSTGGGAFLEFLEGKQLPGVAVLKDK